jgi:hypothetical protein
MLGSIESFIGKGDIVLIKPNVQWWNQGNLGDVYHIISCQRGHGIAGLEKKNESQKCF